MSERADVDCLLDIQEAIGRIRQYTQQLTYQRFLQDIKTQDAVIRNLEIIGEATKNLSAEIHEKHATVPWKGMAGVGDRRIHHYFGVNLDIVWDIITIELSPLALQIENIVLQKPNPHPPNESYGESPCPKP